MDDNDDIPGERINYDDYNDYSNYGNYIGVNSDEFDDDEI